MQRRGPAKVEVELAQVNEPYRTTVILRDIEDLSYEEIAEITGASLGTVKSRYAGPPGAKKEIGQYGETTWGRTRDFTRRGKETSCAGTCAWCACC